MRSRELTASPRSLPDCTCGSEIDMIGHIITEHRKMLNAIAARLVEVETLEREECEKILIIHGITPKKKEEINIEPIKVDF